MVVRKGRYRDRPMARIEDYALLGDLHSAALVSTAGPIDCCACRTSTRLRQEWLGAEPA